MSTLVEQPVVLGVGAHPGDVEILCAGTLALLKERGWRIAVAALTAGECGSDLASPEATAQMRRQESQRSAAVLDAEYYCLEWPEFTLAFNERLFRRATGLLRRVRPAIVLTHGPEEAIPDHEETSRLVRQA
jgi:LmbE family N-acetylglucosaminyl deacetylase